MIKREIIITLSNLNGFYGYEIEAEDGVIGKVEDILFDEIAWTVRYLVVRTGGWFSGKQVLILQDFLKEPDRDRKLFPVDLTIDQVKNSPLLDEDSPVSRQHELELLKYYRVIPYWTGPGMSGMDMLSPDMAQYHAEYMEQEYRDTHLRSAKELEGYSVTTSGSEDPIGHVEDFLAEDDSGIIRYLVIDTGKFLSGKKVIVPPAWIKKIEWINKGILLGIAGELVKNSPDYDPSAGVSSQYEDNLYDYYQRPKYWL